MVKCGEEPGAGLAAKWVSVSNGYMWSEVWGGTGYEVDKNQWCEHIKMSHKLC